jgi:hypothetical protein
MLIRIALIIAILAGLAAGTLNFLKVKESITTLQDTLTATKSELDSTKSKLASTKKELQTTTEDLKKTQTELADTKKERDAAVAQIAVQKKQADRLNEELARVKVERDDVAAEIAAWKALGFSVDQIKGIIAQLKSVQKERDGLNDTLLKWMAMHKGVTNELARYVNPEDQKPPPLPAGLKGKVVVVDPKFDFVVLDVGEKDGALERGEMLVSRDGKLVAKVRIWTVYPNRCVANVVPGWRLAEVIEGDYAVPAL